jgi:hypothetical protein
MRAHVLSDHYLAAIQVTCECPADFKGSLLGQVFAENAPDIVCFEYS